MQICVMDQSGDTRHDFDTAKADDLANAEKLFAEFLGKKYIAAKRTGPGQLEKITAFDPKAETVILTPPLQGG